MERHRPGYARFAPSHIVQETHCWAEYIKSHTSCCNPDMLLPMCDLLLSTPPYRWGFPDYTELLCTYAWTLSVSLVGTGRIELPLQSCKGSAAKPTELYSQVTPIFPSCRHWHLHGCVFICAVLTHYRPFCGPCALYLVNDTVLTQYSQ